jgi:UDP-glucose 4-epimerase
MTESRATAVRSGMVYGSSGFVGQAVALCLSSNGVVVRRATTPRLTCAATDMEGVSQDVDRALVDHVSTEIHDADVVVNAAGVTPGSGGSAETMMGANALFAAVLAAAAHQTGVRLVHVSSSAVQGGGCQLTAHGQLRPFNPYSLSKAIGESLVHQLHPGAISLRPASVHGFDRPMTRRLVAFARSKAAFTLSPGTAPTPQMHVRNVAAAVCHLAATTASPPDIVLQPDEGFTTKGFLQLMGSGRSPLLVPASMGRLISWACTAGARVVPNVAQQARRVEMLMKGQSQESSWLAIDGFRLPYSHEHWVDMVERIEALAESR